MRKVILGSILLLLLYSGANGAVTFQRVIVDSNLNLPHGDWSGDVGNDNPVRQLDAFATIVFDHQVVWYSNTGYGLTWGPKNIIYTSDRPCQEVCAGYLDTDNLIDAVSAHYRSDSVAYGFLAIHKNNGGGTFTTTLLDTIKARLRQMRLVDINNDGRLDIILACSAPRPQWIQESGVYWYRNDGNMIFTKMPRLGVCDAWKCDAYDDDGDNHKEIVISEEFFGQDSASPARIILFKNNGAEGFTPVTIEANLGLHLADPPGGGGVRCAKIDNDNQIDLIGSSSYKGELYWYRNNGGTSFTRNTIDPMASNIDGIDVGDFEPDGDMDIVACGRNYWIAWYENDGNGNFTKHTFDTQWRLFDLPYVTYFDGDTCPDIVVTEASPYPSGSPTGHLLVYLNPCPGAVEEQSILQGNWLKTSSIIGKNSGDILFGIEKSGKVTLTAVDITGRIADVIIENAFYAAGTYNTIWNVKDKANGVYLLLLKSDGNPTCLPSRQAVAKKVTVIR